ncbi:kallikrein-9-like [Kogia breviceps]|uniref:kallikrein-9-like n=1 Tax=Kogia breviceps TaxID=27615 RepID=UPI0027963451|nr:kallikrein-9-like [Kogia breviceps]
MRLRFICALLWLLEGQSWADTRAIGANECRPNSQPWQAILFPPNYLFCGATLISDRWLLTAAHCRQPFIWVLLGRQHLWKRALQEQRFVARDFFPHPEFNPDLRVRDHNNDIMLIRLPRKALLTPAVQPLKLSQTCVSPGTQCLFSGWWASLSPTEKFPLTLQCADVSILEPSLCQQAHPDRNTSGMLCAGHWDGGRVPCHGDSGGPLVCDGALAGVASGSSERCSSPQSHGVYVSVCRYLDWIRKTMEDN